jgi:hypothetical protein
MRAGRASITKIRSVGYLLNNKNFLQFNKKNKTNKKCRLVYKRICVQDKISIRFIIRVI